MPRGASSGLKGMARLKKSTKSASHSLAARIRESPRLAEPKRAKSLIADLMKSADRKVATRLDALLTMHPKARRLLKGIADGSPFLWELARTDPARLLALLKARPEARLAEIIEQAPPSARAVRDEAELMRTLRNMKREAALLVALADLGGVWSLADE